MFPLLKEHNGISMNTAYRLLLISCLACYLTLGMEGIFFSETSIWPETARRHNPGDRKIQQHSGVKLLSPGNYHRLISKRFPCCRYSTQPLALRGEYIICTCALIYRHFAKHSCRRSCRHIKAIYSLSLVGCKLSAEPNFLL
jgi:hypothetical protein